MTLGKLLNESITENINEVKDKLVWKKLGDQYTVTLASEPREILGMIMKQAKSFNDQSASYEVEEMDGIEAKKFPKIADAKKYILSYIEKNGIRTPKER